MATTGGQPGLAMTNIPSSINSFKPHASLGSTEDEKNEIYAEYCLTFFSVPTYTNTPLEFFLAPSANVQCTIKMFQREMLYISHGAATGEQ